MAKDPVAKNLEDLRDQASMRRDPRVQEEDPRATDAHAEGTSRANRADQDRSATHDRQISDRERLTAFRQSFFQSSLPSLPEENFPGFHLCWLTTTNPRDSVQSRQRLGYELLKAEDVPGWEYSTQKSADYPGCVMINEMIAAKLPNHLYQMYMEEVHHHEPAAQEGAIKRSLEDMSEEAKAARGKVMLEDGMAELFETREKPDFTDPDWEPRRKPVTISV